MPRKSAAAASSKTAAKEQPPKLTALTALREDVAAQPGDPTLTREAVAGWREGQRRCRARKRHNWGPFTVYDHGTYWEVVEQCSHCRNRRSAPFVRTAHGLRKAEPWKPDYRDGYLLPKGAMRIDDDIHDELTAADIFSRKVVVAVDDDKETA